MSNFIDRYFLLGSNTGKLLYHEYAYDLPIIDYHCHIDPSEIFNDKKFSSLTEIWLGADHYKWRLMRSCGVDEELITGSASPWDKFFEFAKILPKAMSNPVYHWAHLELQRFFDISEPLTQDTAVKIWEATSDKLKSDATLSARGILNRMNVEVLVTTDDPADNLEWHSNLAHDITFTPKVLPCFRPDAVLSIENKGFAEYISKLGASAEAKITNIDELKSALQRRVSHFDFLGCRAADHGILNLVYAPASEREIAEIFEDALKGEPVSKTDAEKYRYAMLLFLAGEYSKLGWVMELHLGVLRDVNTVMAGKLGADSGFDCVGGEVDIPSLARVLDTINTAGNLPKTLIFSINPNDNVAINTLTACFNEKGLNGKVQQGSAWWFNDTLGGMNRQLQYFAENGVLANFIGMLTDSRSFMSYPRHEYFRRILCNLLGQLVDDGLYPKDIEYLGEIVSDISYNNAKRYFNL